MIQKWPTQEWLEYLKLKDERPGLFVQDERLAIVLDENTVRAFVSRTNRNVGVVYHSPYSMMVVDLVQAPGGSPFLYERLVPAAKDGGVVMIPFHHGKFVLLKQFRHAIRTEQISFPRGMGEDGLSPEQNAVKEIGEELGTHVVSLKRLGSLCADSGTLSGEVTVFSCEIGKPVCKKDYEGIQNILFLDEEELRNLIGQGKITDGFTLSAWSLFKTCHGAETSNS